MMQNHENLVRGRKYGRPKLLSEERRLFRLTAGFNKTEWEEVEARADAVSLKPHELARRLLLRSEIRPIPSINRVHYAELARIASNLNQLAHLANSDGRYTEFSQLEELRSILNMIRQAILS